MTVPLEIYALLVVELKFYLVVEIFFDVEGTQREVPEEICKAKHYFESVFRLPFESEMLFPH